MPEVQGQQGRRQADKDIGSVEDLYDWLSEGFQESLGSLGFVSTLNMYSRLLFGLPR